MPSKMKEVVANAYSVRLEKLGKKIGKNFLYARTWRYKAGFVWLSDIEGV